MRRLFASVSCLVVWLGLTATVAHAHGGMVGPDELGPPMAISGALAIAGYWLMLFWPFDKHDDRDKRTPRK